MATVYTTQGEIMDDIKPNDGKAFTLKELQGIVGGLIELTYTKDGKRMYINEEGKLLGLPYNQLATREYQHNEHDVIVGDAIVIEGDEDGGEDE